MNDRMYVLSELLAMALNPSCWFNLANSTEDFDSPEHQARIADLRNQIEDELEQRRKVKAFQSFIDSLDFPEQPKAYEDPTEIVILPNTEFGYTPPPE